MSGFVERCLPTDMSLCFLDGMFPVLGMRSIVPFGEALPDLSRTVAQHLEPAGREVHVIREKIPVPHAQIGTFQGELPAFFASPQRLLGLCPLRDLGSEEGVRVLEGGVEKGHLPPMDSRLRDQVRQNAATPRRPVLWR
jgi:hypothetical protein